ncbi:MAG: hypothetical protein H6615_07085 [Ignavibacteria bacterium]|nr:hypothetical protein [Ignavibacteria bacterium]
MSTTAPMNYNWTNNTLTYDLPSNAQGVKIKYKKDGEENWIVVFESMVTAPSSCFLPSSLGPTGTIWGATSESATEGWGNPSEESITNLP